MFPINPMFMEKLVQSKQDDILRELPDVPYLDLEDAARDRLKMKGNSKIWVPVGIVLALAWLVQVVL